MRTNEGSEPEPKSQWAGRTRGGEAAAVLRLLGNRRQFPVRLIVWLSSRIGAISRVHHPQAGVVDPSHQRWFTAVLHRPGLGWTASEMCRQVRLISPPS